MYKKLFKDILDIKRETRQEIVNNFNLVETPSPIIFNLTDGIDNDTDGSDRSVTFDARSSREVYKVLQSATKWKRSALNKYNFEEGEGIILETTAIRRDANTSEISSLLWDELTFEWVVDEKTRSVDKLISETKTVYKVLRKEIKKYNRDIELPTKIIAYSAELLEEMYPRLTPKQREARVAEDEGAFILTGLGHKLNEGIKHSERPFDTDDWNKNAEVVVWHPKIKKAMSLAMMAYSVDPTILMEQSYLAKEEEKLDLKYHKDVLEGVLPSTLGGSIFMSRVSMVALNKDHIGQVQISVWKDEETDDIL